MKQMTDKDGNTYKTVEIGQQEWMAENLKVSHFRNGDRIPEAKTDGKWEMSGEVGIPAWCYYENDAENGKTYGKLYNWYAVNDPRGLAPEGWHVPTDVEWTTLIDYLGGESVAGGKLKETDTAHWNSPNTEATNETSFTALPGGRRISNGSFSSVGDSGYWWSAAEDGTYSAWRRSMTYGKSTVLRLDDIKRAGFSVRYLRD